MAILKKGIFSEISGTLGDFVYASRKGKTVVSAKPDPMAPKKPATAAQQAQREKFKLITQLLKPFGPVLDAGFKQYKAKVGTRAKAFKENYSTVLSGVYPNLKINYKDLRLSAGNGSSLHDLRMQDQGGGLYALSWKYCANAHRFNDQLVLVLYEEGQNRVFYAMNLANVGRQQAEFEVCSSLGSRMYVYVFTLGKSKTGNSESRYLGRIA
ncbi:hypothetical protein H9X96_10405 [Pedobacter sp. N36a]|uniref:DUF6266 family protein n=1 Tax=Pedobacter sp. N36a TaxID=2767996 RepID=UPI0016573D54|nr:DUF6266 family protein [Pedobacter sp. N36a]MBC8986184.1 hypothetical protein [Pedobacter sp. N36a]